MQQTNYQIKSGLKTTINLTEKISSSESKLSNFFKRFFEENPQDKDGNRTIINSFLNVLENNRQKFTKIEFFPLQGVPGITIYAELKESTLQDEQESPLQEQIKSYFCEHFGIEGPTSKNKLLNFWIDQKVVYGLFTVNLKKISGPNVDQLGILDGVYHVDLVENTYKVQNLAVWEQRNLPSTKLNLNKDAKVKIGSEERPAFSQNYRCSYGRKQLNIYKLPQFNTHSVVAQHQAWAIATATNPIISTFNSTVSLSKDQDIVFQPIFSLLQLQGQEQFAMKQALAEYRFPGGNITSDLVKSFTLSIGTNLSDKKSKTKQPETYEVTTVAIHQDRTKTSTLLEILPAKNHAVHTQIDSDGTITPVIVQQPNTDDDSEKFPPMLQGETVSVLDSYFIISQDQHVINVLLQYHAQNMEEKKLIGRSDLNLMHAEAFFRYQPDYVLGNYGTLRVFCLEQKKLDWMSSIYPNQNLQALAGDILQRNEKQLDDLIEEYHQQKLHIGSYPTDTDNTYQFDQFSTVADVIIHYITMRMLGKDKSGDIDLSKMEIYMLGGICVENNKGETQMIQGLFPIGGKTLFGEDNKLVLDNKWNKVIQTNLGHQESDRHMYRTYLRYLDIHLTRVINKQYEDMRQNNILDKRKTIIRDINFGETQIKNMSGVGIERIQEDQNIRYGTLYETLYWTDVAIQESQKNTGGKFAHYSPEKLRKIWNEMNQISISQGYGFVPLEIGTTHIVAIDYSGEKSSTA